MEPSSEPVNPMIPVLPSDFDYSNEEIIPLETNKYEKIQTLEGSNFSVIFAVGVGSAVVLAIVVMVNIVENVFSCPKGYVSQWVTEAIII